MKKSKLEIYALAVCFVTIICAAISFGVGIYNIIEIANPEFTMDSGSYKHYQTNEAFYDRCEKDQIKLSDEEKTKQRLESFKMAVKGEQREGAQSLVRIVIILAINIIVFISHWLIAKRARENNTGISG